jgi:hypothetical protein
VSIAALSFAVLQHQKRSASALPVGTIISKDMPQSTFAVGVIIANPEVVDTLRRSPEQEERHGLRRGANEALFVRFFPYQEVREDSEAKRSVTLLMHKTVKAEGPEEAVAKAFQDLSGFMNCIRSATALYPALHFRPHPVTILFGEGAKFKWMHPQRRE